jgi:hypothetical protein
VQQALAQHQCGRHTRAGEFGRKQHHRLLGLSRSVGRSSARLGEELTLWLHGRERRRRLLGCEFQGQLL